jgi:hypothetical protein
MIFILSFAVFGASGKSKPFPHVSFFSCLVSAITPRHLRFFGHSGLVTQRLET